jgi:hypothetical protein
MLGPHSPFAHNGQSSAVDDEMDGLVDRDELQVDIEVPATSRESGVIWSFEIEGRPARCPAASS